eukprot:MONOS_15938.1-p1 / transcript=MONOS_15938.1 / gene=MONOS_15938 / organism=Monocercomonoides_exilis_PA203 / gene_product=60S ribosomal export protein / transcript_product=60S ribosomal export protein / location=Mono_scaffold01417:7267-8735(+) / protein_length=299 / sequence_SO=supercontig / SO=protein_coding / is_pseudo=false
MQDIQEEQPEIGKILCCICGKLISPNPSNTCPDCLLTEVDITEGIPRQSTLALCQGCGRFSLGSTGSVKSKYTLHRKTWFKCELESMELLTLCLKSLKGLNSVKLVDAKFIWTEPHSKRVIIRMVIQKEVQGAILEQTLDVTFFIRNRMCEKCSKAMNNDNWNTLVQLRQKVDHKRTFLFLEQQILKHHAQKRALRLKSFPDGIDFFFAHKSHAQHFASFISEFVPTRMKTSEKQISTDIRNHKTNTKTTFLIEILPVCREDLVYVSKEVAARCGNMGRLCIVKKVGKNVTLVDDERLI